MSARTGGTMDRPRPRGPAWLAAASTRRRTVPSQSGCSGTVTNCRGATCSAADGAQRPGAHRFPKRVLLVGALPGELLLRAPEVPVSRRALVDRTEEIEVLDDLPGLQTEGPADCLG